MEKRCYDCKYLRSGSYRNSRCKSPAYAEFDKSTAKLIYPCVSDVEPEIGENCPHFSSTLIHRFSEFIISIRLRYYKWRHPEWFV